MRVLLVEDHPAVSRVSVKLLRDLYGHEVELVQDGSEVFAAAERFNPDLVLMDIGLPGLDGYSVARQLRSDPRFENTILIALTGHADAGEESAQAGFDAHFVKPMDFSALEHVQRRRS